MDDEFQHSETCMLYIYNTTLTTTAVAVAATTASNNTNNNYYSYYVANMNKVWILLV